MPKETTRVWLASYPKSGNTWVRELLTRYWFYADGAPAESVLDTAVYWSQSVSVKPTYDFTPMDAAMTRGAAMLAMMQGTNNHRRVIVKTHQLRGFYADLPLFHPLWSPRVIALCRDPRDILPSFADHFGLDHEQAIGLMTDEKGVIGGGARVPQIVSSWRKNVESWHLASQPGIAVHKVKYEDLHHDPVAALVDMVEFAAPGEKARLSAVHMAVSDARFDRMKALEQVGRFDEKSEHQQRFFRRGVVGSRDEVDPDVLAKLWENVQSVARDVGYDDE